MSGRRSSGEIARSQLARWMSALPSPCYDVAVVPALPNHGPVLRRRFDAVELMKALPWLRRENLHSHVYARPSASRHILLDDLTPAAAARLGVKHHIAAIVETSPMNLQAWITVSAHPVPMALATAAAKLLAARYGGDPGSADARHLGRMVGFINRKPKHEHPHHPGGFPWVQLRRAAGGVCPNGAALLAEAQARIHPVSGESMAPLGLGPRSALAADDAPLRAARWREGLAAALPAGQRLDRSRADYSVAAHLLRAGAGPDVAAEVLRGGDRARGLLPDQGERYVRRTVEAVLRRGREARA